ncbi:hypothetical protein BAC3_00082 [uncultured bacterium]|nr:hypothetical protein BAC3_00082 [uncultured bacterium]
MTELKTEIQTISLNESTKIRIEAIALPSIDDEQVSITDFQFDEITNVIEAISDKLLTSIKKAKPKKASVEFGLAVGVESGQLTALWVKGQGTAHITVTLEWEGS